jgi:hypothetical protein
LPAPRKLISFHSTALRLAISLLMLQNKLFEWIGFESVTAYW